MKSLIIRVDDVGFSKGVNYGILEVCKNGIASVAGLMSNMEASQHGYDLIKDFNIKIGQHINITVGKPAADVNRIPTLVNESGLFCSSAEIREREWDSIKIQEAEIEIDAQIQQFIQITGKYPEYIDAHAVCSGNFYNALGTVAQRYGIFFVKAFFDSKWEDMHHIASFDFPGLNTDGRYDCRQNFISNCNKYKDEDTCIVVYHPGYLDEYLMNHSSFVNARSEECKFLCSAWLKNFIKSENIEITDFSNMIRK